MNAALVSAAPKIAKLVALLSSDRDGEIIAAVRALGRTLKQAGADFNDLAAVLTRAAPLRAESHTGVAPVTWRDIPNSEQAGWLARMSTSRLLSAWEQNFAASIMVQVKFRPRSGLSEKQVGILDRCISKVAETRR